MPEDMRFTVFGIAFLVIGILAWGDVVRFLRKPHGRQTSEALKSLVKVWLVGEAISGTLLLVLGAFLLFG
jgi:hypothetical protein